MSELRVLQIIKGLDIGGLNGGAERFSVDLSRQLKILGCRVDLCAFYRTHTPIEKDWLTKVSDIGIDIFFATAWGGPNNLSCLIDGFKALRLLVKNREYDILHSHFQQGTFTALWLKRKLNGTVVMRTAHNVVEWEPGFLGKVKEAISDFIYPRCLDAEVGVSETIVEQLSRRYPDHIKKQRPALVFNGIILPPNEVSLPSDTTKKNKFTIGTAGRLAEQKGYVYLLAAISVVLQRHPEAELVLLGDGELRSELEAQTRQLGIESHVEFVGQVSNVLERLKKFDLFVSSSLWEGLPTVIMEAMAVGLPVVATDIPGTREMIYDGENGCLVSPGDPFSLANAIIKMIEAPLLRQKFGDAGKQSLKLYRVEEIAKDYLRLYETLLRKYRSTV